MKEIELFPASGNALQQPDLVQVPVETIYFGGGTPSLLETAEIVSLLEAVRFRFTVSPDAEITLEANPDDISAEKLAGWKQAGVNRLSMGVQSFFEEDLRWMNRAHDARQAMEGLTLALATFPNMTIDLIYGTPGLTDEKWQTNIDTAFSLGVQHLSCYALTVEPKTPLQKLINDREKQDVNPDQQSAQFLQLMDRMQRAGFEHYEISNFARPGHRSRHNSAYWRGIPYLGFGPSAHSFDGRAKRWWNVANNAQYIRALAEERLPFELESLTPSQRLNEYLMISLRTMEGISLARVNSEEWGLEPAAAAHFRKEFDTTAAKYRRREMVFLQDGHLVLTKEGKLLADGIAADLFIDAEE